MEDKGQRGLGDGNGNGNGKAAYMMGEECAKENKINLLGVLPLGSVYDIEAWFTTKGRHCTTGYESKSDAELEH